MRRVSAIIVNLQCHLCHRNILDNQYFMFSVSLLAEDTKPLIIYTRNPYAGDLYLLNLLERDKSPILPIDFPSTNTTGDKEKRTLQATRWHQSKK